MFNEMIKFNKHFTEYQLLILLITFNSNSWKNLQNGLIYHL